MDRKREDGGLRRTASKLKEKLGQLFGRTRPVGQLGTLGERQEDEVRRELRETYDKPTDAIRARSGFRQ
ncbi:MAG: hypothetical protein K0R41_2207 [Geminicoccaceae bacterium]|jgi:hypothetical protein|nr:hypothetical protein [Geminicoccaceae bacterium]